MCFTCRSVIQVYFSLEGRSGYHASAGEGSKEHGQWKGGDSESLTIIIIR